MVMLGKKCEIQQVVLASPAFRKDKYLKASDACECAGVYLHRASRSSGRLRLDRHKKNTGGQVVRALEISSVSCRAERFCDYLHV